MYLVHWDDYAGGNVKVSGKCFCIFFPVHVAVLNDLDYSGLQLNK